tara:strand:+ start:669 stop:1988 length:1320 start_codon:yes stop_codon:yes gene_type:complete
MAIDYTNTGLGGGADVSTLQTELTQLLAESNGASLIMPGDPNTVILDTREGYDYTIDTIKLTAGYFTGGDGTLESQLIYTASLADSNEEYYFNISNKHPLSASAETQFSVTYGHIAGSGSDVRGGTSNDNTLQGETEAIYKQFSSLLLKETEITGGFKISSQGSHREARSDNDPDVYALVGKRSRFKDRINKGTWTVVLSGSGTKKGDGFSKSVLDGGQELHLTDDSKYNASTFTVAGPRYNIVSGAAGTVSGSVGSVAKDHRTFGWFYPDAGVMLFSAHELSASFPGRAYTGSMAEFHSHNDEGAAVAQVIASGSGLSPWRSNNTNAKNALKFVNCLRKVGGADGSTVLRFRSEEDQTQNNYFCRVRSGALNFSNNPSFVSGSGNELRHKTMWGNPTVYISGVGLYSNAGKLVAVAKLSSPIKKNFSSEATIKVKLTY